MKINEKPLNTTTYPPAGGYTKARKRNARFVATGEFRPPVKGEWYLSGSPVEAYQATSDYLPSMTYRIAREVSQ